MLLLPCCAHYAQVANLFPDPYNVDPELPLSLTGQHSPGLPVVDGVRLEMPLMQALRTGLNAVPLLVQTMLAEADLLVPNQVGITRYLVLVQRTRSGIVIVVVAVSRSEGKEVFFFRPQRL